MTNDCFAAQVQRLRNRFGENAFDEEFVVVMGKEVSTLSNYDFEKIVEMFVGNRKHSNPPLIVDFREARLGVEKNALKKLTSDALKGFETMAREPIEDILARHGFKGCKTLYEAVEVQITRNRIKKADDQELKKQQRTAGWG